MKSVIILLVISYSLCFSNNLLHSQTLKLVAEKEIFDMDFSVANQIKVLYSNGKAIGSYIALPIAKEIDAMLKQHSINPTTAKIIIAAESLRESRYYTYYDFLDNIVAIPPYLISSEEKPTSYRVGDTVQYRAKDGKRTGEMDMSGLDRHLFGSVVVNVKLQFSKMDDAVKNSIFKHNSLIFPIDKSPEK
jgi:hypothetical protein